MGKKFISIFLAIFMQAASSTPTINPSSYIIPSSTTPSSTSSSIFNPSSTSSSITNPSSTPSSPTIKPSITTSSHFGFLSPKPPSSYEVTENVIDIPDDRTLSPVVPNFGLVKPLNVANSTISVNTSVKNDTGDENNQLKRTSFTYVHITKDTDTKESGITRLFRGVKDYVYNFKKGVVDSLHNFFHKDDKKRDKEDSSSDKFHRSNDFDKNDDEVDFYHKFHRCYHCDENFDDYEYDEEFKYEDKDLNH